jgi:hypothetical protein
MAIISLLRIVSLNDELASRIGGLHFSSCRAVRPSIATGRRAGNTSPAEARRLTYYPAPMSDDLPTARSTLPTGSRRERARSSDKASCITFVG